MLLFNINEDLKGKTNQNDPLFSKEPVQQLNNTTRVLVSVSTCV